MRLWHIDTIPVLPKGQLLAQWRELNSVFAKEDRHILINYIYEYPKSHLYTYTQLIVDEMLARGYNIRAFEKMTRYFEGVTLDRSIQPFPHHHDDTYFEICYFNLKEKFLRGQKDYAETQFIALQKLYDAKKT